MLVELQPYRDKVMVAVHDTESSLKLMVSQAVNGDVTRKGSARLLTDAQRKLKELEAATRPTLAQFVKLSYLRSARIADEEFKLRPADHVAIESALDSLAKNLTLGYRAGYVAVGRALRQATLVSLAQRKESWRGDTAADDFANVMSKVLSNGTASLESYAGKMLDQTNAALEHAGASAAGGTDE